MAGSAILNWLLKGIFQRPRPHFAHPLLVKGSYSFPSGHAMESFVAYGMLVYLAVLLWLRSWEARVAAVCGAALVVVLIGFSRMYLGVHYFSDVVAGYTAGGVWQALRRLGEAGRRFTPRNFLGVRVGPPPPGATRGLGVKGIPLSTPIGIARNTSRRKGSRVATERDRTSGLGRHRCRHGIPSLRALEALLAAQRGPGILLSRVSWSG